MAKVETSPTPYGKDVKVTMNSEKKPNLKDFYLSGVDIEPAENGFIVNCRYTMKPAMKATLRKKEQYCDTYREPAKHVFEDKAGAVKFLIAEVSKLEEGDDQK